jgi:UDP-N-acetylglucosamine enolpyruvyl transferase
MRRAPAATTEVLEVTGGAPLHGEVAVRGAKNSVPKNMVVALTQAEGISIIHETVYEDRFGYVSALNEMGAQVQLYRECLGGMPCRFGSATTCTAPWWRAPSHCRRPTWPSPTCAAASPT